MNVPAPRIVPVNKKVQKAQWISTSADIYGENIALPKVKTPLDMAITMKEDREALIGLA